MPKILIIEDNLSIAQNLEELLELNGHIVQVLHSGVNAVEVAIAFTPGLIICNLTMPEINGFEVYASMQSNPKTGSIPFVFFTAAVDLQTIAKMEALQVPYLTKPYYYQDLLAMVKQVFETR